MIGAVLALLLPLVGPTVDEAHAAAVADLEPCEGPWDAQAYDCPERARWALAAIADREGPGNYAASTAWVGIHGRDSRFAPRLWERGHRRGRKGHFRGALSWWCPVHSSSTGMSTVGPHGLIYVYNVHRLGVPGNCVPWWVLAAPAVSARVALDRYLERCGAEPDGWCPSLDAAQRSRDRRCKRGDLARQECRGGMDA